MKRNRGLNSTWVIKARRDAEIEGFSEEVQTTYMGLRTLEVHTTRTPGYYGMQIEYRTYYYEKIEGITYYVSIVSDRPIPQRVLDERLDLVIARTKS